MGEEAGAATLIKAPLLRVPHTMPGAWGLFLSWLRRYLSPLTGGRGQTGRMLLLCRGLCGWDRRERGVGACRPALETARGVHAPRSGCGPPCSVPASPHCPRSTPSSSAHSFRSKAQPPCPAIISRREALGNSGGWADAGEVTRPRGCTRGHLGRWLTARRLSFLGVTAGLRPVPGAQGGDHTQSYEAT